MNNLHTFYRWLFIASVGFFLFVDDVLARAGGGGFSGSGSSGSSSSSSSRSYDGSDSGDVDGVGIIILVVAAVAIVCIALYDFRARLQHRRVTAVLKLLAAKDPTWNQTALDDYVTKFFIYIQKSWSNSNLRGLKKHLHAPLYMEWKKQLVEMKKDGIRNIVDDVKVVSLEYVGLQNYADDERDEFSVRIQATCNDRKVDKKSGELFEQGASQFREVWTFEREKGKWLLRSIGTKPHLDPASIPIVNEEAVS